MGELSCIFKPDTDTAHTHTLIINKNTVRALAEHINPTIVMACRTTTKMEEAAADIKKVVPNAKLKLIPLDLSSLKSVETFVEEYNKQVGAPVRCLINNAGVMAMPYEETQDGFQSQFGVNHLGHFYLTNLLKPRLQEAPSARVINVASTAHRFSSVQFDDISGKDTWYTGHSGRWYAYGQSKTCNILFAKQIHNQWKEKEGLDISAFSLHPGAIADTELKRNLPNPVVWGMTVGSKLFAFKSIPQGAATSIYCAVAPELEKESGKYFSDSNLAVPMAYALDDDNAAKLWDVSNKLVEGWKSGTPK